MKLVVVDTALGLCSVGVFEVSNGAAQSLGLRTEPLRKGHQERLGGMARDAFTQAGGLDGVERIAVTVGPGSFTGLRVGLAFAQGLGEALGRPVVGVSTLDALAEDLGRAIGVVVIDARRGEVYLRAFEGGVGLEPPQALSLAAAEARIASLGPDITLIGDPPDSLADSRPVERRDGPASEAIARLAAQLDPGDAPPRPLYLRAPDATPPTRAPGQPREPKR